MALLLLCLYDWFVVSLTFLVIIVHWYRKRRLQVIVFLPITIMVSWGAVIYWQYGALYPWRWFPELSYWPKLLQSSEYYWINVPFLFFGLIALYRKLKNLTVFTLGMLVLAFGVLVGGRLVTAVYWLILALLTGVGISFLVNRFIENSAVYSTKLRYSLMGIFMMPLLLVHVTSLRSAYLSHDQTTYQLERQVAAWIKANSLPTDVIFSTRHIGYWADREVMPAIAHQLASAEWAALFSDIMRTEPRYIVTKQTNDWTTIRSTGWFLDRYVPRQTFSSGYVLDSPFTIWEFSPSPFDNGIIQQTDVVIPDKFRMVGYQYWPMRIEPGENIYVTLYLQATQPVSEGFNTAVRLVYDEDRWIWAWRDEPTPGNLRADWWQPKQIIEERFIIPTESKIPFGAYQLQVSWRFNDETVWPIFQNKDTNPLDRILLGYIAVPPPVNENQATPTYARFGEQIVLKAQNLNGEMTPGSEFDVVLLWEALQSPNANYTVFVHVLDESGQYITGQDSQPDQNRFATRAWRPGFVIEDTHSIKLPEDLQPGTYRILIGLYDPSSGERLPVWDKDNNEQNDRAWLLHTWSR